MQKLYDFGYKNVKLKESIWEIQREQTIKTYLEIPNDSLLYGFRKKAGFPAPGYTLTGWYADGAPSFGQILGALAKFYCQCNDNRILEKLICLVDEWGKTISANGFGGYPEGAESIYKFEKILGGLLDAYEYAGISQALNFAVRYADHVVEVVARDFKRDGTFVSVGQDVGEWYTLPENMYRLYSFHPKEEYYRLSKDMEYHIFWNYVKAPDKSPFGPRHAYSHVNSLSSAMRAYMADKNQDYLETAEKGYQLIYKHHTYATGGYGPCEMLFGPDGYLGDFLKSIYDPTRNHEIDRQMFCPRITPNDSCEIPCCSWAVFKLGGYLIKYTGNAEYSEWSEKLLVNGMGGELPVQGNGDVMYYANYPVSGGFKTVKDNRLTVEFPLNRYMNFRWQCCTGTYPQNVAEYVNMIYYLDQDRNLYISQYLPSIVNWEKDNCNLQVTMDTRYPLDGTITVEVNAEQPTRCKLYVRIPEWADKEVRILINGKRYENAEFDEKWLIIDSLWEHYDIIELTFPMSLNFIPVDKKNHDIKALCYGPMVLAGEEMAALKGDLNDLEEWIICIDDKKKIFETKPGHDMGYDFLTRKFRPYFLIGEMEWYYMYNKVFNESADTKESVFQCTGE